MLTKVKEWRAARMLSHGIGLYRMESAPDHGSSQELSGIFQEGEGWYRYMEYTGGGCGRDGPS